MTKDQIRWASEHDWFLRETSDGAGVICRGDAGESEEVEHRDYRKLREWAGY